MRKKLFIFSLSVILLSCLFLTGNTLSPNAAHAADTTPIRVGHIVDLTGHEAIVGKAFERTLNFAFEQINYTINGRKVEVITGDAQGQPANAIDVARKMVENDKVVAILGPTQAGQKMAVAQYMNKVGVPLILYNPTPLGLFESGKIKWVIAAGGSEKQNPTCMADYLYNKKGYRTINTLTNDSTGGRMFLSPLTDLFTKLGGKVIQQQWTPVPCPDFSPYFATMKEADVLVAWTPGSDAIKFFRQYPRKIPVASNFAPGFLDGFIVKALGPDSAAILNVPGPQMYTPENDTKINNEFKKAYKNKFGYSPSDSTSTTAYQGAIFFMELVKTAGGDTSPAKLMEALSKVKAEGPEGVIFFEKGSLVATRTVWIVAEKSGFGGYSYKTIATYKEVPPTGYVPK